MAAPADPHTEELLHAMKFVGRHATVFPQPGGGWTFYNSKVDAILRKVGRIETDVLRNERPPQINATGFETQYSSG